MMNNSLALIVRKPSLAGEFLFLFYTNLTGTDECHTILFDI